MNHATEFLVKHGAPVLLAAVFIEQMGLPLPSLPWMLAAGALAATGRFNFLLGLLIVLAGCLAGDLFWFYLGRRRGRQVMRLLCRITIEPDSCVRRTENMFTRYGMWGVMVSKFVPGLSTMAPPLAGMSGSPVRKFIAADGLGSLIYGTVFLGVGFLFNNQIEKIADAVANVGGSALAVLLGLIVLYVAYKYFRRRLVLRELKMARITPAEVHERQAAGENFAIIDLRSAADLEQDPALISGAVRMEVKEVNQRVAEIPRDRDVILYCSCPNEVTSAKVALLLRQRGIKRVRPLLGGIDAWREQQLPLDLFPAKPPQGAEKVASPRAP